jgi:hypothetical protein
MTKSPPRVSSIAFYTHRFKRALQSHSQSGGDPFDAYAKLKKQSSQANAKFAKTSGLFIVVAAAFLASAKTGSLDVKTTIASFSVPSVYLLFVSAFLWSGLCFALISVSQLIAFTITFRSYFGRFRNDYEMLVFLKDTELDDFFAPPYHDRFLKPSRVAFLSRTTLFLGMGIAALIPVASGLITVFAHAFNTIAMQETVPLHKSLAIASILLIACSTVFLVSAFIPFNTKKQTKLIRWTFLSPLHRRTSKELHPQAGKWLSEETAP